MGRQYQVVCCLRNLAYAAAAAAVIFVIRRQWNLIGISDACALSGIGFLIVSLFRRARYMRFYDLCIYGVMRFKSLRTNPEMTDKKFGSYGEFVQKRRYEKLYGIFYRSGQYVCLFVDDIEDMIKGGSKL